MSEAGEHGEPSHPEGWFASEQEAVAEEAAWADQMAAEEAVTDGSSVPGSDLTLIPSLPVDEGIEEVDPLDIPDHYDLPMFGSITACPKCNYEKLKTEYHQAGVLSEPCGTRFGWPDIQNLGEHLCRTCGRCKYGWPEAVAHGAA